MMRNRPPFFATWLLRLVGAGPHGEAIEGDLFEAWVGGAGRAWYWRQVLVAISPLRYPSASPLARLAVSIFCLATFLFALLVLLTGSVFTIVVVTRLHRWRELTTSFSGLFGIFLAILIPGLASYGAIRAASHRSNGTG